MLLKTRSDRPTPQRSKGRSLAAETERRIRQAALELLARRDGRGTSMRAIAERAGVTPGAIYRHFPGRRELLERVVEDAFLDFERHLWQRIASQPVGSLDRLATLGRAYLEFAATRGEHFAVLFASFDQPRRPLSAIPGRAGFDVLRQCVVEAIAAGTLRDVDPDELSLFLWTRVHGLVTLFAAVDPQEISDRVGYSITPETLFDRTRELWIEGLKPGPEVPDPNEGGSVQ